MKKIKKPKYITYEFKDELPRKYEYSHRYSLFVLSHIIHAHNSCIANNFYNTKIDKTSLSEEDFQKFSSLKAGKELFDWLIDNRHVNIHFEIIYKIVIQKLLDDLIIFVSEALNNSRKGNLVVTFTLLRKSLKENLILLEWLLVNPKEFHSHFRSDISKISPLSIKFDKKKDLIKEAVTKLDNVLLDHELIYNIRYNKNDYYSYDVIWNHSTHLITTFKGVETENMNINYIFSGEEEQLTQWNALYFLLPYLLYYISEVQNKLFELNLLWKDDASFGSEESKKYLGFIAWGIENEFWEEKYVNLNVFSKNDQSTNILCSKCNNSFSWDIKKVKRLVLYNYIKCDNCKTRIKIV